MDGERCAAAHALKVVRKDYTIKCNHPTSSQFAIPIKSEREEPRSNMPNYQRIVPAPREGLSRERYVTTRDGVRLATDVYLPPGVEEREGVPEGATILSRLPYDKNGRYTFIPLIAEYFMSHGYRVVAQDVRGKFRSEGEAL